MNAKSSIVEEVFYVALQKTTPNEQAGYLDQVCRNDLQLRNEVESLLNAYARAAGVLEIPVLGRVPDVQSADGAGMQVGRYQLVRQIGEGGFGDVYLAEQQEPICREVALKIIKLGMDTRQVIARFEAERQALAMMDHNNIAKVLDAGATDTGRPYFVMELVQGVPITEYCDVHRLATRERLMLFMDVCRAIQHAHQKGIIHRDLKPSNVMVTEQDGKPVPKVIDFGVAKAMQQRLTEKTIFTTERQLIGTPEYMSPEQATFGDTNVDARSDVYSLGVLLYELLVGATPFDPRELRRRSYDEICRVIRESDPPTPSRRFSTLGVDVEKVSQNRHAPPAKLNHLLRGDLDCVVMKAMEKDRIRRYHSAHALAEDIGRHLANVPVVARRPAIVYKLAKFFRKHRTAAIATCVVLSTLVAGLVLVIAMHLRTEGRFHNLMLQRAAAATSYSYAVQSRRAWMYAQQGMLTEALREYQRLYDEAETMPPSDRYYLAVLLLNNGDQDLRRYCQEMLREYGSRENPKDWGVALWTASLAPGLLDDYGLATSLSWRNLAAAATVDQNLNARICGGAIFYRDDQPHAALESLLAAKATSKRPVAADHRHLFLSLYASMAARQAGSSAEARRRLYAVQTSVQTLLADPSTVWDIRLTLARIFDEAASVVSERDYINTNK